ncbi:hypothetical protein [Nonomuraea sp. JJY05]|uniref:hypothetical protein n=1 Tax=Nonomuraea sp. JJY05 TaxID=3350255 RepID=UPI00373FBF74
MARYKIAIHGRHWQASSVESRRGQGCEHPLPQQLVLLATPAGRIRWPLLYATTGNDLAGLKLIGREVHLGAVRQPIPIVVPDLGPTDMDLAKDQVTSE